MNQERPKKEVNRNQGFKVNEPALLFDFLSTKYPENSRSSIKSMLQGKRVLVNGETISLFNHQLAAGDTIEIAKKQVVKKVNLRGITILYEDNDLVIIDKAAGLLSITGLNKEEITAYRILSQHFKDEDEHAKIFIVHRLDQDTSGVMMFAKSLKAQELMQKHWKKYVSERYYIAVVEGQVEDAEGSIVSYLTENNYYKMFSSFTDNGGQKAVLDFRRLKVGKQFTMLEITLDTGRKNQIRVQLNAIGHPIAGDKKYGAQTNPIRRIALHARTLNFFHPITQQEMRFEVPPPKSFYSLVK